MIHSVLAYVTFQCNTALALMAVESELLSGCVLDPFSQNICITVSGLITLSRDHMLQVKYIGLLI